MYQYQDLSKHMLIVFRSLVVTGVCVCVLD